MAKGSVRKKGKKWYYRFYIEDESGKPCTEGVRGYGKQGRNRSPAPQGNGGLRAKRNS